MALLVVAAAVVAAPFASFGTRAHAAPDNIFSSSATPQGIQTDDNNGVELGVKFTSDVNGTVTGVRFYKGDATNGGTHYGHLWTASGTQLAQAQFTSETNSGWQDVSFATPVNISAHTVYIASYYAPQGHYSYTSQGLSSAQDNAPLHTVANSTSPNGVYAYTSTATGGFPNSSYNATNYWVDVDFTPDTTSPPPTTTYNTIFSSSDVPANPISPDNGAVELGVKFKSDVDGVVNGIRFYKGDATNGGTHYGHLWTASGTQLGQVQFTNETGSGWQDATFATPLNITANTTYIASYYAPQGHYSYTAPGFGSAVDNAPLHALANSTSPNGVYLYTSATTGGFPTSSFNASNYWVDVDFTPGNTTPPPPPTAASIWPSTAVPTHTDGGDPGSVNLGVKFTTDTNGYIAGIRFYKGDTGNGGTHVGQLWSSNGSLLTQATFTNETASGWQDVRFSTAVAVTAGTTYTASYFAPQGHYAYDLGSDPGGLATAVNNPPLHALASGTSGGNGVYMYGANAALPTQTYQSSNYWVDVDFTTTNPSSQPTPRPGIRGAGPLLVLTDPTNSFSDTYCNALFKTEGLPECAATDTGNLTSSFALSGYKTIVLADGAPLTSDQIAQITTWVNDGGTFIAMKPDDNLDTLLGVGQKATTLSDAYYKVDATQFPGIETQTMQYHGAADEHALAGATAMAALYSNASTATSYPAVTTKTVGNGKAMAYMFDVAKSVLLTRNGNPALAGQTTVSTDGLPRLADRFGNGWLDTTKASVPQADELERSLANLAESTPLPRLWYFPAYNNSTIKAALILTGDDHAAASQTLNRFAAESAASPANCSVPDWTCYTSTSYAFPNAFSDAAAKPYTDKGFEVSPHVADNGQCTTNWTTQAQFDGIFTTALQAWQASYPSISAAYSPLTERIHCYGIWKDYASVPLVEANHGIKADTNSACWPNSFLNVGQCLFTGTGMPENYADASGNLTGVYQFTTQATDENPSTVTQSAMNALVTNATGANAYYGYFTVLCHLDNLAISNQCASDLLGIAQANNIPMVSAKQAAQFWDGRNNASITNVTYGASTLSFSLNAPVANIQEMTPLQYAGKTLSGITIGGTTATYTTQTINGAQYAITTVPVGASNFVATYQ